MTEQAGQDQPAHCPECGAVWDRGQTCQDAFYQMLYWENENPGYGIVHHLMVLCYYLQHPQLYSEEGLQYSKGLLVEFLESGKDLYEIRSGHKDQVDSGHRSWKITAREGSQGAYANPVDWRMTCVDVIRAGVENYIQSVRTWADTIYEDLRSSGNLT